MGKILSIFCEIETESSVCRLGLGRVAVEVAADGNINIKRVMLNLRELKNIFEKNTGKKESKGDMQGGKREKKGQGARPGLSAAFITVPQWQSLFDGWITWRRTELKKPFKTQRGMEEQYKLLRNLSGGDIKIAEAIVARSVQKEWRDFYPLPAQGVPVPGSAHFKGAEAVSTVDWKKEQADRTAALEKMFGGTKND